MRVIDRATSRSNRLLLVGATFLGAAGLALALFFSSALIGVVAAALLGGTVIWMMKGLLELHTGVRHLANRVERDREASKQRAEDDRIAVEAKLSEISRHMSEGLQHAREAENDLSREIGDLRSMLIDWLALVEEKLDATGQELEARSVDLSRAIGDVRSGLDRLESDTVASVSLLMGSANQGLERSMSPQARSELLEWCVDRLELDMSVEAIRYMERRIITVEQASDGRLAASSADAVFRILLALSAGRDSLNVLEIGTLFGLNAVLLWDMSAAYGFELHQTLVDLFDGYYGNLTPDQYTGLVVSEDLVERNLLRFGASHDDYRLIKGDSTSSAVVETVSDRDYGLVLIDGDHSYEGVSADVTLYWPLVRPGGFMLIDDYGAPGWPDVARFVDEQRRGNLTEHWVGVFARTAVFRR